MNKELLEDVVKTQRRMLRSSFVLSPTAYTQLNPLYKTSCRDKIKSLCQIPLIFPDGTKPEHFLGSLIGSSLFLFEDVGLPDRGYTVKTDDDEAIAYLKESQFIVLSFWLPSTGNMRLCQVVNIKVPSIDIISASPLTEEDDVLTVARNRFEDLSKALAYKIAEIYEQAKKDKKKFDGKKWRENTDGAVQSDSNNI